MDPRQTANVTASTERTCASVRTVYSITGSSVDPIYNSAFVEVDEWRDEPSPHRYVHGGFNGTEARFSFYFPPKEQYQGRFFHITYPLALESDVGPFPIPFDVATGNLEFTLHSGAYYVQTNNGGSDSSTFNDTTLIAFRANAAAAKQSRVIAAQIYGEHRPYGYLSGGSGGALQTLGAAEATSGVWDGFLPFVMGSPYATPTNFASRMHALRILRRRNKFPEIMDAVNPGGSGDPFANLNQEEAAALREVTDLGFPPHGWWNHANLTSGYFAFTMPGIKAMDPTYVEDFWSKPGYLGGDSKDPIHEERVQLETSITNIIPGSPLPVIELADGLDRVLEDADLFVLSGAAQGSRVAAARISDKVATFATSLSLEFPDLIRLQVGDKVRIDNSWALALQTYYRHDIPASSEFYGWAHLRDSDGKPLYPQRDIPVAELSTVNAAGCVPSGHTTAKTLVLEGLADIDAFAWQADWYRSAVNRALGPEGPDRLAVWFIENAQHDNPSSALAHSNAINWSGILQQGLRDLAAWVEQGRKPSETNYRVVRSQVQVPQSAKERGGIQPVIHLRANGNASIQVAVGQVVNFTATVETPTGAGNVVRAEWDFDGVGSFSNHPTPFSPQPAVELAASKAYTQPGTYFAVLRGTCQRQGNPDTPFGQVVNIRRVRITVS
ncbi:hypothetical protein EsH8_VIII_000237 [Colletotrichum jinshuiense]